MLISVKNYAYLKDVSEQLSAILVEKLTLPNPKWLENERMGRWNYKTPKVLRYYRKSSNGGLQIPRGLLPWLLKSCTQMGQEYQLDDKRQLLPQVNYDFKGHLQDFQLEAVRAMLGHAFGTLDSPTGSGKTVMALYMIAMRRQPSLIIVHTKELAEQWMDRIETFLGIPKTECGLIGTGKKLIGEKVTIALVQSLYRIAKKVAPQIGYLLVDECHRCPSRTFTEAVTAFDCQFMTGLSATPFRRDKLGQLIFWHLGDVRYEMQRSVLLEKGAILPVEAVVRPTDFTPFIDPIQFYSKMMTELTADTRRNALIAQDILEQSKVDDGILLALSDRKSHCEVLAGIVRIRTKQEVAVLTGDLSKKERTEVVNNLRAGRVKILIATGQLIGEGFDLPELSCLFLTTPVSFDGRILQYLGRVLRPAPGKEYALVYDYVDMNVETLVNAARKRQKLYQRISEKGIV